MAWETTDPYVGPIVTLPEERIIEDVMKSWLVFLQAIPEFAGVNILPAFPDDTEKMQFPSLVMHRVGEDIWDYGARNSGYYGTIQASGILNDTSLHVVKGVQYRAMYQFDLFTLTIKDQAKYESILAKNFRRSSDFFAENAYLEKIIPVYNFTANPPTPTDLKIRFKPSRDFSSTRIVKVFEKAQVHQTSFSVNFWMDYIVSKEYPRILTTDIEADLTIIPSGIQPIV